MKKILLMFFVLNLFQINTQNAQILRGMSARFNDALVEWDIYTGESDDRGEKGNLTMTWQNPDDWSQWTYRVGEKTGTIKTKWNRDISQWEIRGDNKIITAQMIWSGDPRQWRITDNTMTLELKSKWANQNSEWFVDDDQRGQLFISMNFQNDPRDWNIEDELNQSVSFPMKMAIIFLTMFNSVPKQ